MSLDDFCRLAPEELREVLHEHGEWSQWEVRDGWERMRMGACLSVLPHVKGKITPQSLLPLPWDGAVRCSPKERLTMAERKARMAAAMAKVGLKS